MRPKDSLGPLEDGECLGVGREALSREGSPALAGRDSPLETPYALDVTERQPGTPGGWRVSQGGQGGSLQGGKPGTGRKRQPSRDPLRPGCDRETAWDPWRMESVSGWAGRLSPGREARHWQEETALSRPRRPGCDRETAWDPWRMESVSGWAGRLSTGRKREGPK
ncbi:hypothetical protein NDU88_011661 [Pleurodeles waltl]|uniref:Uncharacterized protein n=1 Tax=Pleurodeles waltl TaxID=8319 RepID=A0AAV7PZ29_PLEWA|nr:hypothetical protein NDU88_011661 [Pleurodeles waltl]